MCIQSVLRRAQPFSLAATPGPWEGSCQHQDEDEVDVVDVDEDDEVDGLDHGWVTHHRCYQHHNVLRFCNLSQAQAYRQNYYHFYQKLLSI